VNAPPRAGTPKAIVDITLTPFFGERKVGEITATWPSSSGLRRSRPGGRYVPAYCPATLFV